jgi:hypothetical protein
MEAQKTQVEELEVAKKGYADKQYGKMVEAKTGLLAELLRFCLDLLQSFPELTVITTGRPMAWLANNTLVASYCTKYDLQMQCNVCTKTTLASLVPQMTESIRQKREAAKLEQVTYLVSCPTCTVKCRDKDVYWCELCNFIYTRDKAGSVHNANCPGGLHSFIRCHCWL